MRRSMILVITMGLLVASSASAFNGIRRGFVLGGGLGIAPRARWEAEFPTYPNGVDIIEEKHTAVAIQLIIGYGWNESNLIVYEYNKAAYAPDDLYGRTAFQGFHGASWYHYFGPPGTSYFSTVGIGLYGVSTKYVDSRDEFSLLLGGGYEFRRHFQAGLYISTGWNDGEIYKFGHSHMNLLISAVAW